MENHAMPRWQCHKVVHGSKITDIKEASESYLLSLHCGMCVEVTANWYTQHGPEVGGYFVRYANGHESYSPADVFAEGYSKLEPRWVDKQTHVLTDECYPTADIPRIDWSELRDGDVWTFTYEETGDYEVDEANEGVFTINANRLVGRGPRKGDLHISLVTSTDDLPSSLFLSPREFEERFTLEYNPNAK